MTAVCIAVSVRNGEAFLAEAIESVLAQTHRELELRVYDNGSSDRSAAIARGYLADGRVSYTANSCDLGYYGSLNRALAETSCPLFVPFAADDVMQPENLAAKVSAVRQYRAGFAHSPVGLIDAAGGVIGELGRPAQPRPVHPAPEFFTSCAPVNCVTCPSVVADTAALRAIGGFDGRIPYCADWHAWMRLSLRHPIAYVDEQLVLWRQHHDSGTSDSLRSAVYAIEDPAALRAALADPALPGAWAELRDPLLAACNARMAAHLERDGHLRAATGHAGYALAAAALALAPGEAALRDLFLRLVERAGLARPPLPLDAVALPRLEFPAIRSAIGHARSLDAAGLLGRFSIGVDAAATDVAVALIEPLLAQGPDLGIDLVAAERPLELLLPGSVALAPFASPLAAEAEARGVPALLHDLPDPFAGAADRDRFQTLAAA